MSKITSLLPDATNVNNLGKLPVLGKPNVNYLPHRGKEGEMCMKNGKKGKIRWINGKPSCVVSGEKESIEMETELKEALKDVTEAKGLRFSSPSRTQIGKQYHFSVDHMTAVQGLGKLKASPIEGGPGNWYFTMIANEENQLIDPSRMNGKIYSGVTVQAINKESQQHTEKPAKESAKSAIERMVKEALLGSGQK